MSQREKNTERGKESIRQTTKLLKAIIAGQNPELPAGFAKALASQSALAHFSDGRGIRKMVLNTHVGYAKLVHKDFKKFDALRLAAKAKLEKSSTGEKKSNKRDKEGLRLRVAELEAKLRARDQELMNLTSLAGRMLRFFESVLNNVDDRRVRTLWKKEKAALQLLFQPFDHSGKPDNVSSIEKARKKGV